MPYYDYECLYCDYYREDVEHPMTAHPEIICPLCGNLCGKVFNAVPALWEGGKPSSEN